MGRKAPHPERVEDISTEALSTNFQHELSLTSNAIQHKFSLKFLDLPLVLVRDILRQVVDSPPQGPFRDRSAAESNHDPRVFISSLRLREVNAVFESEITHLVGRRLNHWDMIYWKRCMYQAPRDFAVRVLEAYIGEGDRGDCEFATQMHEVVDVLAEQCDLVHVPKERSEVLYVLCHAMAMRSWQHEVFEYRMPMRWDREDHPPFISRWDPVPTAFVVAICADWNDVIANMLATHPTVPHDMQKGKVFRLVDAEAYDFGTPLDVSISLGRTAQVEMLLDKGAELDLHHQSSTCRALMLAAERGHAKILERLIPRKLPQKHESNNMFYTQGEVLQHAAIHQQWGIVRPMMLKYLEWRTTAELEYLLRKTIARYEMYVRKTFCLAAKYGQDDVVRDVLTRVQVEKLTSVALRDAAGNGHLSTCKLVLDYGITSDKYHRTGQGDAFARAVARGGNVGIYHMLKERGLWNQGHEICFLPIAAEHGHLDFAKLAVEKGCDSHPKNGHRNLIMKDLDRRVCYPCDIRFFALLRAVASGHRDIIRWLIEEIGVNIGTDTGVVHPEISPLDVALRANKEGMIELLLSMDPPAQRGGSQGDDRQRATVAALHRYQRDLGMRDEDFEQDWDRRTC